MNSINKNKVQPFIPEEPHSGNQLHHSRFESFDSNDKNIAETDEKLQINVDGVKLKGRLVQKPFDESPTGNRINNVVNCTEVDNSQDISQIYFEGDSQLISLQTDDQQTSS